MEARVAVQPVDDFPVFVGCIVVANDMDRLLSQRRPFDLIEKPNPFLMPLCRGSIRSPTGQGIERGQQRGWFRDVCNRGSLCRPAPSLEAIRVECPTFDRVALLDVERATLGTAGLALRCRHRHEPSMIDSAGESRWRTMTANGE